MTWVLFCGFEDREDAERAFGALLEMGIASEDLGLASRARGSAVADQRRARRLIDSGQTHLEELRLGRNRAEREGVEGLESSIGAGIGTDSYDDDVSGVEEMDEAQDVAENLAEPIQGRWYGQDELEDAERFARAGTVDASRPPSPAFGERARKGTRAARPFTLGVMGRALIAGDGPFATEMLSAEVSDHPDNPVVALRASLFRAGVAASEAAALTQVFEGGGAVLALTETPGRTPIAELERMLEEWGASHVQTVRHKVR
ncbi:MAG: hypothetical protein M9921_08270 [Fimbriimonadaceae bacterium]|nr:hypothetical protein [Chthonomonadaceae bacterium]MCO5296838.1 hypothetical protein [Fimbriimonadaceae bacterium]